MTIREATLSDNLELIQLMRLTSMEGKFVLEVDRSPNFFGLLEKRGQYKVFVAEAKKIIGSIAASWHDVFILGEVKKLYYVSDLRVDPKFQGTSIAFRLVSHLHQYLKGINADLLLSTSIYENFKVHPFFGGRLGIPKFRHLGKFTGFHVLPQFTPLGRKFGLDQVKKNSDLGELVKFYNGCVKLCGLASYTIIDDLKDCDNWVIQKNGKIIGAISLCDYNNLKRNIIRKMPLLPSILSRTSKIVTTVFPGFRLPEINKAISILYIKRIAVAGNRKNFQRLLLKKARYEALNNTYDFISIAIHPRDRLNTVFTKIPRITFHFDLWITSLRSDNILLKRLEKEIIKEDYSLI